MEDGGPATSEIERSVYDHASEDVGLQHHEDADHTRQHARCAVAFAVPPAASIGQQGPLSGGSFLFLVEDSFTFSACVRIHRTALFLANVK
jgi:hypothetical protein